MRRFMNIVENAQEGVKSMVEGTTGQDSFSEEDVLANLEFAQEDVDSHPELWQEIGSISGFRLAERTQPLEGQIAFIALRRGEVVASMGCDAEQSEAFGPGLMVDNVAVHPDLQGSGVATALYEAVLSKHPIYAGTQTPGGVRIWMSLIRAGHEVYSIHAHTEETTRITDPTVYRKLKTAWPCPYDFVMVR